MKQQLRLIVIEIVLLAAAGCWAFAQKAIMKELEPTLSLENSKYNGVVVANVGKRSITAQEFLFSYTFGPAFTKREKYSRKRYLNFMVYEKLLALGGYARRLDTSAQAVHTLAEIEGDLATEELYKEDVLSKVSVTEQEIQEGMKQDRNHLTVRWLYARTAEECSAKQRSLASGVPFDSLLAQELQNGVNPTDRSMETTDFQLARKNPQLLHAVDTLHTGAYSQPVPANDGFYIVNVSKRWHNPIVNETENTKSHSDIERALAREKSDSLSDLYVAKIIAGRRSTIIRQQIDILHVYLAKKILPEETFNRWKLDDRLTDRWGPLSATGIAPFKKQTLVQLDGGKFTVNDFLDWYAAREMTLKLPQTSPQAFFSSLEQMVWQMVRDRLLTERAKKRGLQNRESVRKQCAWWKDKIVYRLMREAISDSITYNDSLLERYYSDHKRSYRGEKGDTLSFAKAKVDVRRDFYSDALTAKLLHRILALRKQYGVKIFDEQLNKVAVGEENNPKAIDVYVAKKSGIFPRQAFPSIDYEWQTWD